MFKPVWQIRVTYAIFKVTSFVYPGPYLKLLNSLEDYIYQLRDQLMDVVTNSEHKLMEDNLSKVTYNLPMWGIAVLTYLDVQAPQEALNLAEMFHRIGFKVLDMLDHFQIYQGNFSVSGFVLLVLVQIRPIDFV